MSSLHPGLKFLSPALVLIANEPAFYCPGCKMLHRFEINQPNAGNGAKWTWNGNKLKPTFRPSLIYKLRGRVYCHASITDGRLHYFQDSLHHLAGETITMQPIPSDELFG